MLLGLSIGNPNALDHIPFERHPKARDTPNTAVKKSYSTIPELMICITIVLK